MSNNEGLKCNWVVLKVASRCNLNCTYCYMYNGEDDTYKKQPKVMSDDTVNALLERIRAHCLLHGMNDFNFNFHGGEPLLAGKEFYRRFVEKAKQVLLPEIKSLFTMQTNATLINEEWCELLGELGIFIAISLDGTPEANDMYRIDHKGKGSYERIIKGLKTAQRSKAMGYSPHILSVININSDPLEVYRHFRSLGVTGVDFLLPHANYDHPPVLPRGTQLGDTPYATWLISIFDEWFYEKKPKPTIRFFEVIIAIILGFDAPFDYLGGAANEILVVETDGGIEPVDSLKICANGFTKVGANVKHNSFDDAFDIELARMYNQSHKLLCKKCRSCPVKNICGGGGLADRYSRLNGFDNPSVYCEDLLRIITHIQNRVLSYIPEPDQASLHVEQLSFESAKEIREQRMRTAPEPEYASMLKLFSA